MRTRPVLVLAALALLTLVTAVLAFGVGSVPIPPSATVQYLLTGDAGDPTTTVLLAEVRMPRVITAIIAGAGLAVAGLLMQTLFANPLADPYILGVSSGAGLGVALSVLGTGTAAGAFATTIGVSGRFRTVVAAALGALAILLLVLALARWVRSVVALLIIGVMIGAAAGAVISLLLATPTRRGSRSSCCGVSVRSAARPGRTCGFSACRCWWASCWRGWYRVRSTPCCSARRMRHPWGWPSAGCAPSPSWRPR